MSRSSKPIQYDSTADVSERLRAEQSLRETMTLQRAILDSANYMIIATALDGVITAFNRAAEQMTGYAAAEIVGRETPALIHDAEEIAQHGQELIAELGATPEAGKEFEFFVTKARMGIASEREWTIVRKDKTRFPVLVSITALRDEAGDVTGYLAIGRDITERKQNELALRATEERFRVFMDNNPAVAFIKDDAGRFIYINQSFERLFKLRQSDVIGKTDFDLWTEDVARQVRQNDESVLASGKSSEILETVPTPDGASEFWLSYKFPVKDVSGKTFLGGVAIDVTERERANETRRKSEKRYRHLIEHSQGLICTQDLDGNLLSINPAAARALEYEPEEIIGRNISEFLAPAHRPFFNLYLQRVKESETDSGLFHVVTRSGVERVWQYHNLRYEEAGQEPYIIGYAQDVTELKDAEREVRNLSMTDELTGLYNRRGFLALTEQQQKVSRRAKNSFSLVYADMDGLKQINDRFGHHEGSAAICRVAEILRNSFRESDIIARLGGDEFTIFVLDSATSNITVPLARLEENLRKYNAQNLHDYPLSLSAGAICVEPEDDSSIEESLGKADSAMYENKKCKKQVIAF